MLRVMTTPPAHESILLGLSPVIAATSQREVAQAVAALQKGEPLHSPLAEHQDALLRMAWLVFVRAPSLNMGALAVLPIRLDGAAASPTGDLLPGLIDYLRMLEDEAAAPDSELRGIEILKAPAARGAEVVAATGAELKALVEEALSTLRRSDKLDQIIEEATEYVVAEVRSVHASQGEPQGDSDEAETTPREESQSWVEEGVSLREDHDLAGALDAFDSAIEADPTHGQAFVCRAVTLDMLGRAQEANEDYQAALEREPTGWVYANYGVFLLKHEQFDAAFSLFNTALTINPDEPSALLNRGLLLRLGKRFAEAQTDYLRASELSPELATPWIGLGQVALEAGAPDAESHFDRALALQPALPLALFGRARAREQRGDAVGAAADRALAEPGQKKEADRYYDQARWRALVGDPEGAVADYDSALALNPEDVQAMINQGVILQQLGDAARALVMWDRAVKAAPTYANAYVKRGMGHVMAGNSAAGAADLQEALRLAPADWPMQAETEQVLQMLANEQSASPGAS